MGKTWIIILIVLAVIAIGAAWLFLDSRRKSTIFRHRRNRYKDSTRKRKNADGTVCRRKPLFGKNRR